MAGKDDKDGFTKLAEAINRAPNQLHLALAHVVYVIARECAPDPQKLVRRLRRAALRQRKEDDLARRMLLTYADAASKAAQRRVRRVRSS